MYSPKLRSLLNKKRLKPGDRISVQFGKKQYEGLLMPRPEIGDVNCLVIKLDNGYNFAVSYTPKMKIARSTHREPKAVREEEEFELGKISKKLLKVKWNKKKPPVSLIAAGGTISSRVDYRTGGVHATMKPEEILHNVPELADIMNLKSSTLLFTKMSEDLDPQDWIEIARHAARELNSESRGMIITHGTDFLHYTAAALSFFLKGLNKPVVLLGAQRSSDRGSSDAGMNLICSAHTALGSIAEVGTCMHGSIEDSYCLFI
ncbi:MAG: asparaginase domain-containing protein, partial [Candidatus Aenigmatarchaeota archaeon]